MRIVQFDRDDQSIRQMILLRFDQLSQRIHTPSSTPLNPFAEIENLFDLLEFGQGGMAEPEEIGSQVRVSGGEIFVKIGTNAWIKANPDTTPVFPVPWVGLLNPQPLDAPVDPPPEEPEPVE